MRIIAGSLKNRIIQTLPKAKYRPSTSKFREAIFNILNSYHMEDEINFNECEILDLFAGSGGLSFEAISQGAPSATLIDINPEYLNLTKQQAQEFDVLKQMKFIKADATNLPTATKQFDLVFIDPPYFEQMIDKTLRSLINKNWLKDNALIIIETPKTADIELLPNLIMQKQKIYNNNKMLILRYQNGQE